MLTVIHNDKENKVKDISNEKKFDLKAKQKKFNFTNNMDLFIQKCIDKLNLTHFPDNYIPKSRGVIFYQNYYLYLHEFEIDCVKIKIVKDINDKKPLFIKLKIGESLSYNLNDQNLLGFKLKDIFNYHDQSSFILFENGKILTFSNFLEFNSLSSFLKEEENLVTTEIIHPYINLLQKVSEVTNLTRHSIFDIYKGLTEDRKLMFLKNPDKFINIFISTILSLC